MINKTFPITDKLLDNGLEASSRLFNLLTQEASHLKQNADATTLSTIASDKKQVVLELDQFSKQMAQVLATENLKMSPEGITTYFEKAESIQIITEHARKSWEEILTLSKQNRFLNEKNGASINLLTLHVQRSLHILKGKSQQATTYGSDGSTYSEHLSHSLVTV